ncbi:ABC transporter ATP-binding protein [Devosia sp. 919]|uniref:ABC transporter ATP-binding protein n=1 Tax=Devosia sp. 919 TaxID=2726065 RepID=UPI001558006A|nr:ABC transporter ATP-binding protein [Devosia sp. 919]
MTTTTASQAAAIAPLLSVRDLNVSFRTARSWKQVLNGVSFDLHAGRTLAIVGESGSGKSVSALAVMGLHDPVRTQITGSATFEGENLLGLPMSGMNRIRGNKISMIFQEPMTSLNPVMSVGQQLCETIRRHRGLSRGEAKKQAIELMDKVHIPSAAARFDEYQHRFSGGMRQRIMIAMALACRPRILIADEPTTALDVTVQAQILNLIKELQREEDMAVLFITHDMGVVAEVADETMVMFRGDMLETGSSERIFRSPQHAYTRKLLASVPKLGEVADATQPVPFPEVIDGVQQPVDQCRDTVRRDLEPVLRVNQLQTRFDVRSGILNRVKARVHAVEGISFDLRQGETLSIVGESGCGKSTTGRSFMGLAPVVGGTVTIDGQQVAGVGGDGRLTRHTTSTRPKIQFIFQDPFAALNPRQRVGDAIVEPFLEQGLGVAADTPELIRNLLDKVGLPQDAADRFPHEFSGGQRQRICIARALSVSPKILVADEVVSALDVSIKTQVINLLLKLQEETGISLIFISHDMAVVERVSHRVAVMYMGEIVEIGPRQQIFNDPRHPYTQALIAAVPIADPASRTVLRPVAARELTSPIRPPDFVAPKRQYREVGPEHLVRLD